jgi:cell filamentation protein
MKDQEYDYFYDDEADAKYCYPKSNVLINMLDIRDFETLHQAERELNMIHPFREGNGRTQRIYIEQLCMNNGRFEIDFTEVTKDEMIADSVASANCSNDLLEKLIIKCLNDDE